MKAAFYTLGCKLNQVETDAAAASFKQQGYEIVQGEEADVYFINTCAVTSKAEAKSRRLVRKLAREFPGKVIAAGCLVQLKREKIALLDGLKMALGTKERFDFFNAPENCGNLCVSDNPVGSFSPHRGDYFRSRAFVKIQDGCDHRCSYCIVPILRGKSVSLDKDSVVLSVTKALENGGKEIVLTGVDIGSYKDASGTTLAELLEKICKLPEVRRIRLSSVEPPGFTEELTNACGTSEKVCPHFHIPLQSGSDNILRRIGRNYTGADYLDLVNKLAGKFPDAKIGADLIVGLPGETDEEFIRTLKIIEQAPITHIHVFPFSPRPGTEFKSTDDRISAEVKAYRAEALKKIVQAKNLEFMNRMRGTVREVFFEGDGSKGGFTDNYIRTTTPGKRFSGFQLVKLKEIRGNGMTAIPV